MTEPHTLSLSESHWLVQSFDAVLFDFNGTLADDESIIERLIEEILYRNGRPALAPGRYGADLVGRSDREIFDLLVGPGHPDVDVMIDQLIDAYRDATETIDTVAAETVAFLKSLANVGVPLGVVTGAYRLQVSRALTRSAITDCFDAVVTADDVVDGKPHPEGYLRAMTLLGVTDPSRVLVFEDSDVGVAAAEAAGTRCIRVRHRGPLEAGTLGGFGPNTLASIRAVLG